MRSFRAALALTMVGFAGAITLPEPADAQQFYCTYQCQTAKGDRKGSSKQLSVSNGYACISAGKKAVKDQCGDTGVVRYGACYGRIVNGKTVESRLASC